MKRARFTKEQTIGVLKEAEAGAKTVDLARCTGGVGSNGLQLKGQVLRAGGVGGEASAGA